jgi:uncharacterized protein
VESAEPKHYRAEVLIAPTWDCNLGCTYCFVRENEISNDGAYMSPEVASRIVDALDEGFDDVRTITIHLYGGEPFINLPASKAMVDRALQKKPGRFTFSVTTNGMVLTDETLDVLERGKFYIILSIDGPAEIHDECRRKRDGSPTHANVIRFLETVRSQTSCVVCGSSVVRSGWGLREATDYLRTLPIHSIKAQAVRVPKGTRYSLSPEERAAYMEDLEYIGRRVIEELETGKVPKDNRFASRVLQLLKGVERQSYCGAGTTTFGITPGGNVLPCLLLSESEGKIILGHVNDDPKTWREAGRDWKAKPLRPECKSCSYLYLCGGGCPAMISVCAQDECELVHKNCEVSLSIYEHFKDNKPEALLGLAGIT